MKSGMRLPFLLLPALLSLASAGCHSSIAVQDKAAPGAHAYAARGVIEHISNDRHLVTIHHQAIPGYMMEMTMDFPVHDEHVLDAMVPGDRIDFVLEVTDGDAWVKSARRTGHVDLAATEPQPAGGAAAPLLKPGGLVPDARFLAETGRQVRLSDFRGKVVAFTFFFTRCPLPNYCPLVNHNFAEARALLLADSRVPKNWQLISISFDPDFDTPQTLTSYANLYRGHDSDRWLFVSAPPETLAHFAGPLGLEVMREGNNISHNLRTVVIDPQGRLVRQFNDNLWQPRELADTIKAALRGTK